MNADLIESDSNYKHDIKFIFKKLTKKSITILF